jgi:dihydrofolate synthase/folylpolyglutamate synthase
MVSQAKDADRGNCAYEEALSRLYRLQKYGIKFGLSKTSNLLKAFGDPHRGQKYIHIAGTNGKGSVGAMLESILIKSGLKVGFFTSPHLVSFTERFRINQVSIDKEQAAVLINEVYEAMDKREPPTFFEITTAIALIYFARTKVDIGIMEVGMGGRLDATNVITPLVSVITNIGLDHNQYLGATIMDIAREKAGIIKPGVDVVTGVRQGPVKRLLQSLCKEKGSPLWILGHDARYRRLASGLFCYYGAREHYADLTLGLKGRFQYRNAALCLLVLETLEDKGISVSEKEVRLGLADPFWPGRLEVISWRPTIILDGAHNTAAMRSLADSIKRDFHFRDLVLVVGIMADKDILRILREIVPLATRIIFTRPAYYRAAEPQRLLKVAEGHGWSGEVRTPLSAAIDAARNMADERDLILITGSLFTVGEAKSYLDPTRYPGEYVQLSAAR